MFSETPVLYVSVSNPEIYSANPICFPHFNNSRQQSFYKHLYINQTNKLYCIISSQYRTAEFSKMTVNNVESLPASRKVITFLNINELLYAITFTYIIFAVIWSGRYYVIAVDYYRYAILKHCCFGSDTSKSVARKYFTCKTKWTLLGTSKIPEKRVTVSWRLSVHPSVHIE